MTSTVPFFNHLDAEAPPRSEGPPVIRRTCWARLELPAKVVPKAVPEPVVVLDPVFDLKPVSIEKLKPRLARTRKPKLAPVVVPTPAEVPPPAIATPIDPKTQIRYWVDLFENQPRRGWTFNDAQDQKIGQEWGLAYRAWQRELRGSGYLSGILRAWFAWKQGEAVGQLWVDCTMRAIFGIEPTLEDGCLDPKPQRPLLCP